MGMVIDRGDADYGTSMSRVYREQIRQGIIQAPSGAFDLAVAQIYEYERAAEAAGVYLGTTDIRGAGTSVS